jgi:hypothetical protein
MGRWRVDERVAVDDTVVRRGGLHFALQNASPLRRTSEAAGASSLFAKRPTAVTAPFLPRRVWRRVAGLLYAVVRQ